MNPYRTQKSTKSAAPTRGAAPRARTTTRTATKTSSTTNTVEPNAGYGLNNFLSTLNNVPYRVGNFKFPTENGKEVSLSFKFTTLLIDFAFASANLNTPKLAELNDEDIIFVLDQLFDPTNETEMKSFTYNISRFQDYVAKQEGNSFAAHNNAFLDILSEHGII